MKRFLMAYFLLFSLPGGIVIPYGDEYAQTNRLLSDLSLLERQDMRNVNRGSFTKKFLQEGEHSSVNNMLSHMLHIRQGIGVYFNVWPRQMRAPRGVFSEAYHLGNSRLNVFINLTDEPKTVVFDTTGQKTLITLNDSTIEKNAVHMGGYGCIWLQE